MSAVARSAKVEAPTLKYSNFSKVFEIRSRLAYILAAHMPEIRPPLRHRTFPLIAAGLIAATLSGLAGAARSTRNWWDNLAGPDSSNFVDLDEIKKSNVGQLEVAWSYPYATPGFNPVVVDDVMYVLGRNNSLIALDATTGKELWIHEGLGGIVARGINYWQSADGKDKRLLFSINSYLQAIDATTGKSILTFGENGTVDLRIGLARAEHAGRIQSNSPGKIWKNLIILGSAAGEAFIAPPGDIRAYDVVTGQKVWQFHTIPQPGEFGYDTWPKEAYKYVGGANNWGSMSVDEERGIVYVPTGSANYDFYGADRVGQNLFANCLLALDAKTGKRLWHFQTVHHDLWDFDNVAAPQLVTVRHNGRKVDAVALAGKTNFLYVFDRVTGKPLWPIEERPVPKSEMPGEKAWPTQPWPTKPAPFGSMTFTVDDVNPWLATPEQYRSDEGARGEGPQRRAIHTAGVDRHDLDARQPGRRELGDDGVESGEGAGVRRRGQSGRDPQAGGRQKPHAARGPRRRWRWAGWRSPPGRLPRLSAGTAPRATARTCAGRCRA